MTVANKISLAGVIVAAVGVVVAAFGVVVGTTSGSEEQRPAPPVVVPRESIQPVEPPPPTMLIHEPRHVEQAQINDHCQGGRDVRWRVNARDGWEIDVSSIEASVTSQSSKSSFGGIAEVSVHGFTITGRTVNNGDCIRVFGKTVARDGRGSLAVRVDYTERRLWETGAIPQESAAP